MTKMNLKVCYTGEFLNVKQIAFDLLKLEDTSPVQWKNLVNR